MHAYVHDARITTRSCSFDPFRRPTVVRMMEDSVPMRNQPIARHTTVPFVGQSVSPSQSTKPGTARCIWIDTAEVKMGGCHTAHSTAVSSTYWDGH